MEISPRAEWDLKKLRRQNPRDYERVMAAIWELAGNPRPPGAEKLSGREAWRIRVGDYRVIYLIEEEALVVTILGVAHRREVYRRK